MYEFGGLFILFNLLDSYSVKYIIKFFGFKNQSDLENCLRIIKNIRNIIAHHENILCRYSHRSVKQYHHKLEIYEINPEYYKIKTKTCDCVGYLVKDKIK
jgi:abortive infection bacteriophage resistance protein